MITSYEKKATEVRLKKDYATLANALKMAEAEYGPLETWDTDNPNTAYKEYFKRLAKYIQFAVEPCYDEYGCFPKNPGLYYSGIFFRLKDGTYGVYYDNGHSNGGHKTEAPRHFFRILTSEKSGIKTRTVFEIALINLRDLRIQATSGFKSRPISGNGYCPEDRNEAWAIYYCTKKFMINGFKFTDDYNFNKNTKPDKGWENMLKTKPRGWQ